ncbi:MAG: hypothetical protein FD129_263, partial [bacterium]
MFITPFRSPRLDEIDRQDDRDVLLPRPLHEIGGEFETVGLEQRLADGMPPGRQERERHAAADQE